MIRSTLAIAATFGTLLAFEEAAHACGGCFVPTENPTVVTDHRMIFSISPQQSTLYDQIRYSGNPDSFAWVLPYSGDIEVGLSSDALFQILDSESQVQVFGPPSPCPPPPVCGNNASFGAPAGDESYSGDSGVTVLVHDVVGPYERAQLSATDPKALETWLSGHGFVIPNDVKPVVDDYQSRHFDFLALKLVPGKGVQDMRPVRVTTKGANVALPLKMVAAGTGATVGITLWVVASGRYEPQNFDSFVIKEGDLTWDWNTSASDYTAVRAARTAAGNGRIWEIESAQPIYRNDVARQQSYYANLDLVDAGAVYAPERDDAGTVTKSAEDVQSEDLAALFAGITPGSEHLTRMRADLVHAALDADLQLRAASSQAGLDRFRRVTKSINPPECPVYSPCPGGLDGTGTGGADAGAKGSSNNGDDSGCQTSSSSSPLPWAFAAIGLGALSWGRKRRNARKGRTA